LKVNSSSPASNAQGWRDAAAADKITGGASISVDFRNMPRGVHAFEHIAHGVTILLEHLHQLRFSHVHRCKRYAAGGKVGNTVFAELIIGGQSLKAGTWRGGPSGKAMRRRQHPSRSALAELDTMVHNSR
jgi:hypothetical protein